MNINNVVQEINNNTENINLVYAFNSTGKTRISVEFKNIIKKDDGQHAGVYYNSYSEDLFLWKEDDMDGVRLSIQESSLNKFHNLLTEDKIREKLKAYMVKFNFKFKYHENPEQGIDYILFFSNDETKNIKISRGEERVFILCFLLSLFEVEGLADVQDEFIFLDDPVTSLDENNIFVTAFLICDIFNKFYKNKKIILTTHHIGFFSILFNWLKRGEYSDRFKDSVKCYILSKEDGNLILKDFKKDVFLYHLHLLQEIKHAISNGLYSYHFVLLRQLLENIASFVGSGRFSYILEQIGLNDSTNIAKMTNILSHKNLYTYEFYRMSPENESLYREIFDKLITKYGFIV